MKYLACMILWIALAVLTAAVAAVLLAPLMKARDPVAAGAADEAAVYRDQLREIGRDRELGLIGAQEADYARAEIGRRLLAVSADSGPAASASAAASAAAMPDGSAGEAPAAASQSRRHPRAFAAIVVVLPAVGLCLYLMLGQPGLPDQPLAARLENPGSNMALLVAKAERHLAQNPEDGAGWDLLAPIYFRSMRLGDAEMAYRRAIALLGETPERLAGLGETLVAGRDGVVIDEAQSLFEKAASLDPGNMRARFYVALALEQSGRKPEALAAFRSIAADSPPGAAWADLVEEHILSNGGTAPSSGGTGEKPLAGPDAEALANASALSPADRRQMIDGMVASLAARLKDEPANIDGWLQLVRSYAVLGRKAEAQAALERGLKTFGADGPERARLTELAREMRIDMGNAQGGAADAGPDGAPGQVREGTGQ